ncbi:MAG: tRNA pseudouridine(38-40) synthase TruA [Firmicutes bacterium]|nr:tRNA pseudouridine(38-40) synthase TruA [Bacillota bacterium]
MIVLRFLGTKYHGWQIQKNATTVQEIFQNALSKIKSNIAIKGCSRTDAGVHANVYCVSAKINIFIDSKSLILALNKFLPDDIKVISCTEIEDDFHARYSCIAKEYLYRIYNCKVMDPFLFGRCFHFWYSLDFELINKILEVFIGKHDFTSFCSNKINKKNNMIRNIEYFDVLQHGNIVEFKIKADGFLYNMVRIMIGTVLRANHKKHKPSQIIKILEAKNRSIAGQTVPAYGLYLNKIFYKNMEISF